MEPGGSIIIIIIITIIIISIIWKQEREITEKSFWTWQLRSCQNAVTSIPGNISFPEAQIGTGETEFAKVLVPLILSDWGSLLNSYCLA